MSEFSLALEQAERDRAARAGVSPAAPVAPRAASDVARRREPERDEVVPVRAGRAGGQAPIRSRGLDARFVALLAPTSIEADQYRVLAHFVQGRVERRAVLRDRGVVIAITSPRAGEGKTTTAVNLAGALAQSSRARVLLLDADFRRSDLIARLGLGHVDSRTLGRGVQARDVTLETLVCDYPQYDLSVLAAGPPIPSPYDFLSGPRLGELLDQARARFGYVIVDTPAFTPWPDSRAITAASDGVLLVVAAHRTSRRAAHETALGIDPAKLMGIVVNRDDDGTYAEPERLRDRRRRRRFFAWRSR
jgi:Mrp family chromosome partitioning ATPase